MEAQPIIDVDSNGVDLDFAGTTISAPNAPAIRAQGSRIAIRNATVLGGSGDPRLAYRIHKITARAARRLRRRYRAAERRKRALTWAHRRRFALLLVLVALAGVRRLGHGE